MGEIGWVSNRKVQIFCEIDQKMENVSQYLDNQLMMVDVEDSKSGRALNGCSSDEELFS